VLNALRHQRFLHLLTPTSQQRIQACSTPYGIKGFCTRWDQSGITSLLSAQRLTASKVFALDYAPEIASNRDVLNALRHQRFLHELLTISQQSPASSAQRLTASKVFAHHKVAQSTVPVRVLNALRHQRFLHLDARSTSPIITLRAQRLTASKVFAPDFRFGMGR